MSSTTPTIGAARTRPPATTIAAAALQVLIGTVTSFGGLYFGLQAGGAWIVSATLFAVAWPPQSTLSCWPASPPRSLAGSAPGNSGSAVVRERAE